MCNLCPKYDTCKKLCNDILKEINISLGTRKNDSDKTDSRETLLTNEDLESILYSNALSENEYSRVSNLIIAILTPKQKMIMKLFSEGKTQEELAEILNVTQSAVSQYLRAIKKEISKQFYMVINL
ncbi:sigma factor-like helix-turn-helix DNA-binding protein [uncultured Brachyspira sp.]|uniref:sigma factor-like helix-turn-helix DNA-binding protein n=1 Tax=uncultured Brachyspira sp. TaxID=221953 RepID=UPI0025E3AC13|nr:sigma factor-like helix-turn-helix DNA-binding protein [uncultured Brachyspira sp.]